MKPRVGRRARKMPQHVIRWNVEYVRLTIGLSVSEMAATIGFSEKTLYRWARGERSVNPIAEWIAGHLLYYHRANPVTGWLRFALGFPATGPLPPRLRNKQHEFQHSLPKPHKNQGVNPNHNTLPRSKMAELGESPQQIGDSGKAGKSGRGLRPGNQPGPNQPAAQLEEFDGSGI